MLGLKFKYLKSQVGTAVLIGLMLLTRGYVYTQPAGYGFGKQISFRADQVAGASDFNDFPVLVNFTDNDLRTTANGGNVENSNGYDIIFTLGDCATQLNHQIEEYNAATGNYVAWIRIPTLSASTNTNIHMYYGNSSVATDPSTTNTWSTAFDGVWHLHDDFLDASGNANNGTNNGSTDVSPAKSGDGQEFQDPNHWIELTNHPARGGDFTYTAWIRTDDRTIAGQRVICDDASNGNGCHAISLGDPGAGRIRFYIRGLSNVSLDSPALISNNTWAHVAATFNDATNLKTLYINGASVATQTANGTLGAAAGNASIGGEVASGESGNRFDGDIDEVHSLDTLLSTNWITTEYNNQNIPDSFYNVTAEFTAANLCSTLPIELLSFEAKYEENRVLLKWTTATETNNDFFEIERSPDRQNWEVILSTRGAGTSNDKRTYKLYDVKPIEGVSYYRLKQVDIDDSFSYSGIRTINVGEETADFKLYPNPSGNLVTLHTKKVIQELRIISSLGQDVTDKVSIVWKSIYQCHIDISKLETGRYLILTENSRATLVKGVAAE
ncbi:MAG: hypothetical protein Salg2KO_17740 [Salibacteraceae bacterium]